MPDTSRRESYIPANTMKDFSVWELKYAAFSQSNAISVVTESVLALLDRQRKKKICLDVILGMARSVIPRSFFVSNFISAGGPRSLIWGADTVARVAALPPGVALET